MQKEINMKVEKIGPDTEEQYDYKKKKYVSLFSARTVLTKIGTMEERRVCSRQLKRMKKKGTQEM